MHESKYEIVKHLRELLVITRFGSDIDMLYYRTTKNDVEYVDVVFHDGHRQQILIDCDSGIAIIKDVLKALGA